MFFGTDCAFPPKLLYFVAAASQRWAHSRLCRYRAPDTPPAAYQTAREACAAQQSCADRKDHTIWFDLKGEVKIGNGARYEIVRRPTTAAKQRRQMRCAEFF